MLARLLLPVSLALVSVPAAAEDVPLPPLTPEGEHLVMTQDDATSSSQCIGDPVTPMCAVETMLACFAREDSDLCRIGMGLDRKFDVLGERPWNDLIYRITRAEILTGEHFPWRPAHDLPWRPGEISMQGGDARIDILLRECKDSFSQEDCRFSFGILSFIVRREKGRWSVMMWQPPHDSVDWRLADAPNSAEDVPLPGITPEGEYMAMTQDSSSSTSKCIGNPVTPMCAMETVLACYARGDDGLCQIAMGLNHEPGFAGQGPWHDMLYRVTRAEVLTVEHFPWRPRRDLPWRFGEVSMQEGDIRLDVIERHCFDDVSPKACSPSLGTISYIIRRRGSLWAVMEWQPPYDVED